MPESIAHQAIGTLALERQSCIDGLFQESLRGGRKVGSSPRLMSWACEDWLAVRVGKGFESSPERSAEHRGQIDPPALACLPGRFPGRSGDDRSWMTRLILPGIPLNLIPSGPGQFGG